MNVLIFEADAEFRDHLAQRLGERGFSALQVGGPEEALRVVAAEKIGAVILGIGGLRRKALAFMERLLEDNPGVRVILINRSGDVSLSIEAMRMGAFDEVPAPVDMEMLENKLRAPRKTP